MTKYTIQMNDKLESVLENLAEREGISKAQVVRRGLTLLKLAEDQSEEGFRLALVKDDEQKEIVL